MTRSSRRLAGVDAKLIIALSLFAIIGLIWVMRWSSEPSRSDVPERLFKVVCSECKHEAEIPASELEKLETDPETGLYKCPQCGKFAFRERRSGGSIIEMDP